MCWVSLLKSSTLLVGNMYFARKLCVILLSTMMDHDESGRYFVAILPTFLLHACCPVVKLSYGDSRDYLHGTLKPNLRIRFIGRGRAIHMTRGTRVEASLANIQRLTQKQIVQYSEPSWHRQLQTKLVKYMEFCWFDTVSNRYAAPTDNIW